MDAKSALEAVEAIRGIVPVEEQPNFDAELTARYGVVSEAAGTVAVAEAVATPETQLEKKLPEFLNADVKLSATEQRLLMNEFWRELGYTVPDLNVDQKTKLQDVIDDSLSSRVVPTPLLDVAGRKLIAERAKYSFNKNDFHSDYEPLWAPDTSHTHGKLLADPESTVKEGRKEYGLRYQTPDGEIVSRAAYIDSLVSAGQAVLAEDGTVWTFPVMDVRVQAPRTREYAAKFLDRVTAVSTPESLITMHLLHQANGTPNPEWEADFANEAVYELGKRGNPLAPVSVASVGWNSDNHQVDSGYWYANDRKVCFGVRAEKSGL